MCALPRQRLLSLCHARQVTAQHRNDNRDPASIIGLEFLVADLDGAIAVFVDALGWELVERGPAEGVAGERAVLVADSVVAPAVTLMAAAEAGPGMVISDRTPRLTQVVMAASDTDQLAIRLNELGLPTESSGSRTHVDPAAMAGVWGADAALVAITDISPHRASGPPVDTAPDR